LGDWQILPVGSPTRKKIGMTRTTCLALLSVAIAVTALEYTGNVGATPAVGFAATTVISGKFGEVNLLDKVIIPDSRDADRRAKVWLSQQKTEGPSDLYVQSNVWQPRGSTGWHTHPGHSLIVVTAGTVTEYWADDPECKPHAYTKGMTFVDHGGDHAHIVRNEGNFLAQSIAVQLIPAGATRRIDVADPGHCHF
jgi:quercetin dioxygenase-like cupin family protein